MDFSPTVLPHLDSLRKQATRLTRNRADSDDLIQDTLLRAWRHWGTFVDQGNNSVKAWLYRILFNCFVNQRNASKRRNQVQTAVIAELSTAECQLAVITDQTLPHEIRVALDELSAEFRVLIEAVDLQGATYADCVAKHNIPLGTVMSRIYRGRRTLEQTLRPYAESVGAL